VRESVACRSLEKPFNGSPCIHGKKDGRFSHLQKKAIVNSTGLRACSQLDPSLPAGASPKNGGFVPGAQRLKYHSITTGCKSSPVRGPAIPQNPPFLKGAAGGLRKVLDRLQELNYLSANFEVRNSFIILLR
jgi:hypothetical protein